MRITDMRGVDLSKYRFDYDLTFAALTLDARGRVYHRFGGRDGRSSDHWTTEDSFAAMLEASLVDHRQALERPAEFEAKLPLVTEKIPAFAKRDKGACIHCHNSHEALHDQRRAEGLWKPEEIWVYPEPLRLGFDLDRDQQSRVSAVSPDSAAAKSGLRVGDVLLELDGQGVVSATDVMHVADGWSMQGGEHRLVIERAGQRHELLLELSADWKRGDPRSFAWRSLKWTLEPVPGFGGPLLASRDLKHLGLAETSFAFRVQYFVTWGPRQAYGRAALAAGLRKGDVVLAVGGKADFESVDHMHAWWRLTRRAKERVPLSILRDGERLQLELKVLSPWSGGADQEGESAKDEHEH